MTKYKLSNEHPIAKSIRKIIGASDDDIIEFVTPQFERPFNWPKPEECPEGFIEFAKLFNLTVSQLKKMGCGNWDGRLMLFPKEWYDMIPNQFPIEDINGNIEPFIKGETDDDIRFGFLSYGVVACDGVSQPDE